MEVCVEDVWGTVCDNNWDDTDARVFCRHLGFLRTGTYNIVLL